MEIEFSDIASSFSGGIAISSLFFITHIFSTLNRYYRPFYPLIACISAFILATLISSSTSDDPASVSIRESSVDAVTGLSGSGPAYVFLVAEAMIDAGVMTGLSRPIATELAIQTLLGAATLLPDGKPPAELRADVTSPGGTTAAGLRELESHGLRAAFAAAIEAASRRSQELGRN